MLMRNAWTIPDVSLPLLFTTNKSSNGVFTGKYIGSTLTYLLDDSLIQIAKTGSSCLRKVGADGR